MARDTKPYFGGGIRLPDLDTYAVCLKDTWGDAYKILPNRIVRRPEYRLRRMTQLGMCQSRMNGYVEEFFVPSVPTF